MMTATDTLMMCTDGISQMEMLIPQTMMVMGLIVLVLSAQSRTGRASLVLLEVAPPSESWCFVSYLVKEAARVMRFLH